MPDKETLALTTIETILTQWPQTARVFHQFKMACVGCALAPYFTLNEAVNIYQLSLDDMIGELMAVIVGEDALKLGGTIYLPLV